MKNEITNPDSIEVGDVLKIGNTLHEVIEVDVIEEMYIPSENEYKLTAGVRTLAGGRRLIERTVSYETLAGFNNLTVFRPEAP